MSIVEPVPATALDDDPRWARASVQDPARVRRYRIGGQDTVQESDDPGHLIPADLWDAVVAGAAARERDLEADASPGLRSTAGVLTAVDRTIPAYAHGGTIPGGPRLGVLHSAETPLRPGYAYSIAANWFGTSRAGTSATVMIDPAETIRMLPDNVVAYHCGPRGNGFTLGVEQAGYASGGRKAWLADPLGLAQMRRVAGFMRDVHERWDMPLRRATDAQIRAAARGELQRAGWCEHDDIRRVLGGTTHTDPGDYPWGELLDLAGEAEDMTPEQDKRLARVEDMLENLTRVLPDQSGMDDPVKAYSVVGHAQKGHAFIRRVYSRDLPALRKEVAALRADVAKLLAGKAQ